MDIGYNEFEEIAYGDDYEEVTKSTIVDQSRWNTFYEQVFRKKEDGSLWKLSWSRGSTEQQDSGPEDITLVRVRPVQKTITVYEEIDE